MIDPQAEAIKRLISMAKSGAQRTPLAPRMSTDPTDPAVGLLWIREDERKAYLKISDTETLLVASAEPVEGGGGGTIDDRSIAGIKLMLNTITANELADGSVGANELQNGVVNGVKLASAIEKTAWMKLYSSALDRPPLHLDAPYDTNSDLFRVERGGTPRFQVGKTTVAIGEALPGAVVSLNTDALDNALRIRAPGAILLGENELAQRLISVDASGNLVVAGSITSLSGDSGTQGSMSVEGTLTVTDQANFLSGMQVSERADFLAEMDVNGRLTLIAEPYLPPSYSAKIGDAVHLRTITTEANRLVLEGVDNVNAAEIQLGTGGPVLQGSLTDPDQLFLNDDLQIITSGVDGILGSQLATDTITGATGPNVGNIAAETITGYNILNESITSTELSPGAVVAAAIAEGAVGEVALADGSVVDRVVASMGVGKLISGTLNADEVFMGPSGRIFLGPTTLAEITGERIQMDSSGIRAYNDFNTPLAEFTPGGFTLRTGLDGARLEFDAGTGLELFGTAGERTGYLSPLGEFQLDSLIDGARMSLNSQMGIAFHAGATRNLAFNPGFIDGSDHELAVAGDAEDDQEHVFAGEWAVKFQSDNPNVTAPSYVDVPFKNTVGTGTTYTATRLNACSNPSGVTASTGWAASAAGVLSGVFSPSPGFIHDVALKLTATQFGFSQIVPPGWDVIAGQQWAMSVSVRVSEAKIVTPKIFWYDVNGAIIGSAEGTKVTMARGVVAQVGMVAVVPPNAVTARLQIYCDLNNTEYLEVGNALFEQASRVSGYFDGETEGYRWVGTPHAATSALIPVEVPDSLENLLSVFVWSPVEAWVQIEGWDTTAGVSRGLSLAVPVEANQWSRATVVCNGVMDKARLHYISEDQSRQTRIVTHPVWFSALQVEADRTTPTPFCSGDQPGCRWEGVVGSSASVRVQDTVVTQISPQLGTTVSGAIVGGSMASSSFFSGRIFGTEITGVNIKGSTLTGNFINGDQIIAGSLHANRITANTITADRIGSREITADKLEADLVLSSRIIAGASTTGARVELVAGTGIQAYTPAGVRSFFVNSTTGKVEMIGDLSTGVSGRRIQISSIMNDIRFYPQAGETRYARVFSYIPTNYPNDIALRLQSIDADSTSVDVFSRVELMPDFALMATTPLDGGSAARHIGGVFASNNHAKIEANRITGTDDSDHVSRARVSTWDTQLALMETWGETGTKRSIVQSGETGIYLEVLANSTTRDGGYIWLPRGNGSAGPSYLGLRSGSSVNSYLGVDNDRVITGVAGATRLTVTADLIQYQSVHGTRSARFWTDSPGDTAFFGIQGNSNSSGLYYQGAGGGWASLKAPGWSQVTDHTGGFFRPIRASAFEVNSGVDVKTDFRQLPEPALGVLRQSPAALWKYRDTVESPETIGPVAEDLPEWLTRPPTTEFTGDFANLPNGRRIDVVSMLGMLWEALRELDAELDEYRRNQRRPVPTRRTTQDLLDTVRNWPQRPERPGPEVAE